MTRWLASALLIASLASCRQTRCEDLEAVPIAGVYKGGGSLGEERLLRVAIDATGKKVVLTYAMMDGSKIRATYRVSKKTKKKK
ncbi:MAG TPA: hypothetical protein VI299_26930 [Polyangiales bacterium]